jgi:hypothetical protein
MLPASSFFRKEYADAPSVADAPDASEGRQAMAIETAMAEQRCGAGIRPLRHLI